MFDHTGDASCCHVSNISADISTWRDSVLRIKALDGSQKHSLAERSAQVTWGLKVLEMSLISPILFPWYIHLLHQRCGACSVEILVPLGQRGQERLALVEGVHTQPGLLIPHRNLGSLAPKGGKGLFQREGLWLWPSTTLSLMIVVWKVPTLHPLSVFISLHHL